MCEKHGEMGVQIMAMTNTIASIDLDGDGTISKEEYLTAAKRDPSLIKCLDVL